MLDSGLMGSQLELFGCREALGKREVLHSKSVDSRRSDWRVLGFLLGS